VKILEIAIDLFSQKTGKTRANDFGILILMFYNDHAPPQKALMEDWNYAENNKKSPSPINGRVWNQKERK
jgi:hypothetical protein